MSLYYACAAPACGALLERKAFEPVRRGRICRKCVREALEPMAIAAARTIRLRELVIKQRRQVWLDLAARVDACYKEKES